MPMDLLLHETGAAHETDAAGATPNVRRRRVLVVDDDSTACVLMSAAFEEAGFAVCEAADGVEALRVFVEKKPDLVVLDVLMPNMNGFAACAEIRRRSAQTPILMLTALDDLESINRAYAAGATDFATKPISWVLLSHRVRYLLRAAEALASAKRNRNRLETAQRIAHLGYWERDLESSGVRCSREIHAILGTSPHRRTLTRDEFMSFIHPEDTATFEEREGAAILTGEPSGFDFRIVRRDGRLRYVHQETEVAATQGDRVVALAGTLQDITDRREAEDRLRFLAHHDPLTQLPNRVRFSEWLGERLEQGRTAGIAVLSFDVDQFSRINETFSRSAGDAALQQFAERLSTEVMAFDPGKHHPGELLLAHAGADKFLVAIVGIARDDDAALVARGIQSAMRNPFLIEQRETFISMSAGLSLFPRDGRTAEELLANADSALRHAKSQSRGSYQFFSKAENHKTARTLSFESGLRRAIERDELRLHFQPQLDTTRNVMVGVEALVRWQHPTRGLLQPSEFIQAAEETGVIVQIGEWVLRTACEQIMQVDTRNMDPLMVSVNLSPRQLRDKDLVPTVERILRKTGFDARYLDLEITETGLMGQAVSEISVLHELKDLGLSISVDDFGTGYSCLSYLTRLPLDTLKIDKSFINDCTEKDANASVVRAIIAMASSLKLTPIAEGVSTQAQVEFLRANGCPIVQGYLFAEPRPVENLAAWVARWPSVPRPVSTTIRRPVRLRAPQH